MLECPAKGDSANSKGKAKVADSVSSDSHAEAFDKLRRKTASKHNYSTNKDSLFSPFNSRAGEASSTDSEVSHKPVPSKRLKKPASPSDPKVPTFDPAEIIHPRASNWLPTPEVGKYVQSHTRKTFDKEVRAQLHVECPRPDLEEKIADTPEIDPTMVTFMKKYSRDPKKGLDRAWRTCQDKLLDMSGPLTKILELAFQSKEYGLPVDTDILIGWVQRAICHLAVHNRQKGWG
ncbi:hypothetical protein NDU88_007872 [Pleurodeles waltl]|uniref:Uncharacterized protein n=1 Tax=Pleurodeles waltl TaxID=8319 RepID=A0AAV7RTK6_PLEWA|nr:hypothetical protein NDU88_007872 [Pleurodeles waltl]